MSVDVAASKLGLTNSKANSKADKLHAIERGETSPTHTQLQKMANVYHRPLLYFYMKEKPLEEDILSDFRSRSQKVSLEQEALLQCLIRDVSVKQDMIKSLLEEEAESMPVDFVNSLNIKTPISQAVYHIKRVLYPKEISSGNSVIPNEDKDFRKLRERIEQKSIFVLLAGDLGSHHTKIDKTVFRGFALPDHMVPFIVINSHDSKTAQSFTLIHELVHLLVGEASLSGSPLHIESNEVEQFCNDVASELLLPTAALETVPTLQSVEQASKVVRDIAVDNAVSESLVAYRLFKLDLIDRKTLNSLYQVDKEIWSQQKQHSLNKLHDNQGRPSYYTIKQKFPIRPLLVNIFSHVGEKHQIRGEKIDLGA